jgi:hypothetical protein
VTAITDRRLHVVTAAISALLTLLFFTGALYNQFVALDDYAYIVNNRHIEALNPGTLLWGLLFLS